MKEYKNFKSDFELADIAINKGINCFCVKTNTKAEYDKTNNILIMTTNLGIRKFEPQLKVLYFDKKGRSFVTNFIPFKKELKNA